MGQPLSGDNVSRDRDETAKLGDYESHVVLRLAPRTYDQAQRGNQEH